MQELSHTRVLAGECLVSSQRMCTPALVPTCARPGSDGVGTYSLGLCYHALRAAATEQQAVGAESGPNSGGAVNLC